MALQDSELIFPWNRLPEARFRPSGQVLLTDESLRDGLQAGFDTPTNDFPKTRDAVAHGVIGDKSC